MISSARRRSLNATVLLLALTFGLPRLLVGPGYMPGADHAGHWTLVFCDPEVRAAFGEHDHSHTHTHHHGAGRGENCPFGMSGSPALFSPAPIAGVAPDSAEITAPTANAPTTGVRLVSAHGARAPPVS